MQIKTGCINSVLFMFWAVLFIGLQGEGSFSSLRAEEILPASVWTSAETTENHSIDKMIDGTLTTWSQILDDSRNGAKKTVLPPNGSTPVTALLVFDLGKIRTTGGIRLTAQKSHLCRLPQNASFFACDDPKGKVNRYPLAENVEFPPIMILPTVTIANVPRWERNTMGCGSLSLMIPIPELPVNSHNSSSNLLRK